MCTNIIATITDASLSLQNKRFFDVTNAFVCPFGATVETWRCKAVASTGVDPHPCRYKQLILREK